MFAQHVTVPEPARSKSNITLRRCNVINSGYASNTILPRYAIVSPVLTLCSNATKPLCVRPYNVDKCYPSVALSEV